MFVCSLSAFHCLYCPSSVYERPSRALVETEGVGTTSKQPKRIFFSPVFPLFFSFLCSNSEPKREEWVCCNYGFFSLHILLLLLLLPHHTLLFMSSSSVLFSLSPPIFCMSDFRLQAEHLYSTVCLMQERLLMKTTLLLSCNIDMKWYHLLWMYEHARQLGLSLGPSFSSRNGIIPKSGFMSVRRGNSFCTLSREICDK